MDNQEHVNTLTRTQSLEPNRVDLSNGSYLLYDTKEGQYRVVYYERRIGRSADLEIAISLAMKKPVHNKSVREVVKFVAQTSAKTRLPALR